MRRTPYWQKGTLAQLDVSFTRMGRAGAAELAQALMRESVEREQRWARMEARKAREAAERELARRMA